MVPWRPTATDYYAYYEVYADDGVTVKYEARLRVPYHGGFMPAEIAVRSKARTRLGPGDWYKITKVEQCPTP